MYFILYIKECFYFALITDRDSTKRNIAFICLRVAFRDSFIGVFEENCGGAKEKKNINNMQ